MKRNTTIVSAVVGGVLLIGWIGQSCSSTTATPSAPPLTYISNLATLDPSLTAKLSEADLTTLGNAACSDFGVGDTPLQVAEEAASANQTLLSPTQMGEIIGAAVYYLCPAYNQTWLSFSSAYAS